MLRSTASPGIRKSARGADRGGRDAFGQRPVNAVGRGAEQILKLAGMTGTAMTEAQEFSDIYKLEVIEIPTNEPVCRDDTDDEVYRTTREKFDAIVQHVLECQEKKQPMLIGTVSIEKSRRWHRCSKSTRSRTTC